MPDTFDLQAHDEYFGVKEDRKKPGGSNAGKYKKGPFCGPAGVAPKGTYPVNTKARAISAIAYARNAPNPAGIKRCVCRHWPELAACKGKDKQTAMEVTGMPTMETRNENIKVKRSAMCVMDYEGFAMAQKAKVGDEETIKIVAYSGGIIKDHWYWGNLAIDLAGMKFKEKKYPILENHDTSRKIGFSSKPTIENGAIEIMDGVPVDTEASREFKSLSEQGFPYQASIYANPTKIERIPEKVETSVNGMTVKGPISIWRESIFKEASICVFGWDPNTTSVAMANDNETEISVEVLAMAEADESNTEQGEGSTNEKGGKEAMDINELMKDHKDLYDQIVKETTDRLTASFAEERSRFETRILSLEKAEAIQREKEFRLEANAVWVQKLSASQIPDRLHSKVMGHVRYQEFVKDGSVDMDTFSKAVDAEIKDWVGLGISNEVIGTGFASKGVEDEKAKLAKKQIEDDESTVTRLLKLAKS
jgi:hypothetical protein